MPSKRIAIVGTGANGAGIGADLVRAGLDVTFIEQWPANVEAMRRFGVRVEMPAETTQTDVRIIDLCDVAMEREEFDVVFIVVKAYDTAWACELIKPLVAADGLVVGLQNGMTIDVIARIFGPGRTLGAVIEVTAAMFTPGLVERHTPPAGSWFGIGAVDEEGRGREPEIAEILHHSGTVEIRSDIRSAKWMKLVVNSGELVTSAILNLPLAEAIRLPGMHEFMLMAAEEAARTAQAVGNELVPIFGLEGLDLDDPYGFASGLLNMVLTSYSLPHTKTTVLQDWQKGRHSEVDELNGLIVQEQERLGGSAPANEITVRLAHEIESGLLEAHPRNADTLTAVLSSRAG